MSINAVPDPPTDRTSREPAMQVGAITSLVTATTAVVGLLIAFGAGITPAQGTAIVATVVALSSLAPLASGWFTRGRVYAPATVAAMQDEHEAELAAAESPDLGESKHRWPDEKGGSK